MAIQNAKKFEIDKKFLIQCNFNNFSSFQAQACKLNFGQTVLQKIFSL